MNHKYELDKTLIDAYNYHRSDMFQEALECYMEAVDQDPENNEIWFEMGVVSTLWETIPKPLNAG